MILTDDLFRARRLLGRISEKQSATMGLESAVSGSSASMATPPLLAACLQDVLRDFDRLSANATASGPVHGIEEESSR